ncbi:MAG: AsmA family protein, partial [Bacteroidetes bacterium]
MKKILKIITVVIILIFASLLILPVIFKDKIIETVKQATNENLNAKVDFGEFDLTLFKNFPDFTFEINNVSVKGIDKFEGISLLSLDKLTTTIDLGAAISGDIKIKSFELHHPVINAIVLADSSANWDITKPSEEEPEEEDSADESSEFKMALKHYGIYEADIFYKDETANMEMEITNLTHTGNGDFTLDNFILNTLTTIQSITYDYEGVKMLNKAKIEFKCDMEIDMPNSKYTFKENTFSINDLALAFDGFIAMPNDEDIETDLTFSAQKTDFKSVLSLVPAVYMTDFQNVKTSGNFSFSGYSKGIYNENQLPAFDLKLAVNDARFKYPDLPKSVENININTHIYNPGGSEDNTVIDISNFHLEMGENPVDIKLLVKTPVSDPYIKTDIVAQIDLSSVQEFIPVEEGEKYSGNITSDIHLEGKTSDLENEQYDRFKANGKLIVLDLLYYSPSLGYDTKINSLYMDFTPENVNLTSMEMTVGKSDIALSGKMDNLLSYYFDKAPLKGSFEMTSNFIDVNELMGEEESEEETAAATDSSATDEEPFEVPANMDIDLKMNIQKLLYDNM